jgi:hypothetical protein
MKLRTLLIPFICTGCAASPADEGGANPFLDDQSNVGKVDTAYQNPDGVEVEVDLEADLNGASSYQLFEGPAHLAQFAMTWLRKRGEFYLESLAEDSSSEDRVEWSVGGAWITTADARKLADKSVLKRFRLRAVNAVLLRSAGTAACEGHVFTAKVPEKPFSIMSDAGASCADSNDHISLSQGVYWYRWEPENPECKVALEDLTLTVSKVLPKGDKTWPEYDRLMEDGKVTAVVLFGKIDDGEITEWETGMRNFGRMQTWLKQAGFSEVEAPVGKRFSKKLKMVTFEIDLYSPHEFSGLSDFAHWDNFQKAIAEHELVAYDGHSMLGASDYWARPMYPTYYQMFLYGGCLGYEYYVRPILGGKGGWQNVDILSSTIEVSVSANEFAGPVLAKVIWALDNGGKASWQDILTAVRQRVGDSTFGVSGVRDNCFTPTGSRCR